MKTHLLVLGFILARIISAAQTWTSYDVTNGLANNDVRAIAVDAQGNKWFGTYGGGLSKFDGTNWTTYSVNNGLVCDFVRSIKVDDNGHLWIGTDGGVSKFNGTGWDNYTTFDGLSNNMVYAVEIDSVGNKWFATNMGVSKFDGVNWTVYTTLNGLPNNIVSSIAIDQANNLWFGTWGGGVTKYNGANWITYSQANYVSVIKPETNGTIWFGTPTGLKKFNGTTWTNFTTSNGLAANDVYSITFDLLGNKWFGTNSAGISKYNGFSFTNFNTSNGLIGDLVNVSFSEGNGNIWIGTEDGVSVYGTVTAIKQNYYKTEDINVYPIPSHDFVKLSLAEKGIKGTYSITDTNGNNVKSGEIQYPETEIGVNELPVGVYLLQVSGNKNQVRKIIKN